MRFLLISFLLVSCTYTVQPADLPPSFYGIDVAEAITSSESAFLGIEVSLLQSADVFSLDVQPGIQIKTVAEESPAANAGIRAGDILLSYEAHPTDDPQRLTSLLALEVQQRAVVLEIQRGSEVLRAEVELQMKSTSKLRSKYFVERGLLRVAFFDNDSGQPRVAQIGELSPLLDAGLEEGDVVRLYQGVDPGSSFEIVRRIRLGLSPGDEVSMTVVKADGSERVIGCTAWAPERFITEFGLWPLFYWKRHPGEDKGVFTCGNLVLVDLFSYQRDGHEKQYSILGLLEWKTGELILEEE